MFVDLTPEQHALRRRVRDYFTNLMTPELRAELRGAEGGEQYRRLVRQMGKDGWLAVGWPKEYGGQGYAATEQLIFFEEANIAIGYTEPSAGSDLATLKTRATLEDGHFIVNGNKIFTSGIEGADYVWLAVRTDPDLPRHKGISILIVDTRLPGSTAARQQIVVNAGASNQVIVTVCWQGPKDTRPRFHRVIGYVN